MASKCQEARDRYTTQQCLQLFQFQFRVSHACRPRRTTTHSSTQKKNRYRTIFFLNDRPKAQFFKAYTMSPTNTHFGTWKKTCCAKIVLVGLYCMNQLTQFYSTNRYISQKITLCENRSVRNHVRRGLGVLKGQESKV